MLDVFLASQVFTSLMCLISSKVAVDVFVIPAYKYCTGESSFLLILKCDEWFGHSCILTCARFIYQCFKNAVFCSSVMLVFTCLSFEMDSISSDFSLQTRFECCA